jgi:hypothetical protein
MDALDVRKIVHPELRDFASSKASSERRSVIVELGGDPPQLAPRGVFGGPASSIRSQQPSVFAHDAEPADSPKSVSTFDQLKLELASLGLNEGPVALKAAEVFVVSVTPEELRKLSLLPHAGMIRPNRQHKLHPAR